MIKCTFHLNGGAISTLSCPGIGFFPAYSGNTGLYRNNPDSAHIKNVGPLPPGKYFIVNRPLGGLRTAIKNYIESEMSGSDRSIWFALYRDDGKIDDVTFYESVLRGQFRLHPSRTPRH